VDYLRVCFPLYFARPSADRNALSRGVIRNEVALHFNGPANEHGRMDFCTALGTVRCPVLVLAGERDPITPPAFSEEIARCLPPHLVRFERFPDCGHGVFADVPERAFAMLREFITPMMDNGAVLLRQLDGCRWRIRSCLSVHDFSGFAEPCSLRLRADCRGP